MNAQLMSFSRAEQGNIMLGMNFSKSDHIIKINF